MPDALRHVPRRLGGPFPASTRTRGAASDAWWLYVLLCANERLYVGIARDVDARFAYTAPVRARSTLD